MTDLVRQDEGLNYPTISDKTLASKSAKVLSLMPLLLLNLLPQASDKSTTAVVTGVKIKGII